MFRYIVSLGLLFWMVFVSLPIDVFVQTQSQTPNEQSNTTKSVFIQAQENPQGIELNYTITERFNRSNSHGIFLAIPKQQGGTWTTYSVQDIKWNGWFPGSEQQNKSTFTQSPYQLINEWNQLRVRVGNPNQTVPQGQEFTYTLRIQASKNRDYQYPFTLLTDWQEPIEAMQIQFNSAIVCDSFSSCGSAPTITLHSEKPPVPQWHIWLSNGWIYGLAALIAVLLNIALYSLWAQDPSKGFLTHVPEYEAPENITPWQAQSLTQEGRIGVKETLLSYLLYLNHLKYIVIERPKNDEKDPTIRLLRAIPDEPSLPPIYKTTVQLVAEHGMKKGILASKINDQVFEPLNTRIIKSLKALYDIKPLVNPYVTLMILGITGIVGLPILHSLLQSWVLLGDSWLAVMYLWFFTFLVGFGLVAYYWGKLNRDGYAIRAHCERYKYYVTYVEKEKLEFINTPEEGVQYYLKNVPYAAAFGVLSSFTKYFAKVIPESDEIQIHNSLSTAFRSVAFYTPPSSVSSDSGASWSSGGFSGGGGSW
jgi:hypothetical protein